MIAMEKAIWHGMSCLITQSGSYSAFTKVIGECWDHVKVWKSPKSIQSLRSQLGPSATIKDVPDSQPPPPLSKEAKELADLKVQFESFQKAQAEADARHHTEKEADAAEKRALALEMLNRLAEQAIQLECAQAEVKYLAEDRHKAVVIGQ